MRHVLAKDDGFVTCVSFTAQGGAAAGELRAEVDSVFPLREARAAFERVAGRGKRGKVVLEVGSD